jgi:hypothetical protein
MFRRERHHLPTPEVAANRPRAYWRARTRVHQLTVFLESIQEKGPAQKS